jgi:hypothetical protein
MIARLMPPTCCFLSIMRMLLLKVIEEVAKAFIYITILNDMSIWRRREPMLLGDENHDSLNENFKFDVNLLCANENYWDNEPYLKPPFLNSG